MQRTVSSFASRDRLVDLTASSHHFAPNHRLDTIGSNEDVVRSDLAITEFERGVLEADVLDVRL
jgi:hypothetical protein